MGAGRLERSGVTFLPALAASRQAARAPAQRSSPVVETLWSHPLRLRFPVLPLRGGPLRGLHRSDASGASLVGAIKNPSSGHGTANGFTDRERIAAYLRSLLAEQHDQEGHHTKQGGKTSEADDEGLGDVVGAVLLKDGVEHAEGVSCSRAER